jgi:hypothetical protein
LAINPPGMNLAGSAPWANRVNPDHVAFRRQGKPWQSQIVLRPAMPRLRNNWRVGDKRANDARIQIYKT